MKSYKFMNLDLRNAKGNISSSAIGEKLGVRTSTVDKYFRTALSERKKAEILKAINEIKNEMRKRLFSEKEKE